jgi:hypothetical protein
MASFFDQPGEVNTCELPVEGRSHALEVFLETQQSLVDFIKPEKSLGVGTLR